MSDRRLRSSSQQRDWLHRRAAERERPWALEEQLLAPTRVPERERRLAALVADILRERGELTRLQETVSERLARLAQLEAELRDLLGVAGDAPRELPTTPASDREVQRTTVELGARDGSTERGYQLGRCHGYRVESSGHTLGVVEGVRYGSSATRPDVIEVRAHRLGRRVLLIDVEDVEDIIEEDETLLLRASVLEETGIVHALLARARGLRRQVAT